MALTIVATLKVRRSELEAFRRFERIAVRIMRRHSGELLNAVFVDSGEQGWVREVHVLRFESAQAFKAYREDSELCSHASLRDQCVLETEVLVGESVDYASSSSGAGSGNTGS